MNDDTILEVKSLSVVLDTEPIVEGISFKLHRQEAVAIIGPNGAGKTTLLRALLGLVRYKGEVGWGVGVNVGYVPQRFALPQTMPITVREFFLLKSPRFWTPTREFITHLPHEIKLVGLDVSTLDKPLGELSSGQLQRLLVSWALVNHPNVLLFDEPTAGVDVGFGETIYGIMDRVKQERGTAILLISHDLNVVYRHADHVLCVNRRLFCQGPPSQVLTTEELTKLYGDIGFYRHSR
jgi:zinc transport system ATP-binding protein